MGWHAIISFRNMLPGISREPVRNELRESLSFFIRGQAGVSGLPDGVVTSARTYALSEGISGRNDEAV